MALTFLGALMVAVLAACVAFVVNRWTGARMRWLIPASAGAAMLGFTIWSDYTWFGRTVAVLGDGFVVTAAPGRANPIQPWSFVAPVVASFAAVEPAAVRVLREEPRMVAAPLYLVERFTPTRVVVQVIDCARGLRADAPPGAAPGPDGVPTGLRWTPLPPDHPLLAAACPQDG